MTILLMQLVLALIGTLLFAFLGAYPSGFLGIMIILLVFVGAFLAAVVLFFLVSVPLMVAIEKPDRRLMWKHRIYVAYASYLFSVMLRVRVRITGGENLPKNNRFAIYANHIELTDPFYIMQAFRKYPLAFLAKAEIFRIPVVKNILRGMGCVCLARGLDRQGLSAIQEAIATIEQGQPLAVFPEGTRSYRNDMGDFKAGAFKIALRAKADIVPVCLFNMHDIFKRFRIGCHTCYLHILPAIPYEEYGQLDSRAISEMVRERIETQLQAFKLTSVQRGRQ